MKSKSVLKIFLSSAALLSAFFSRGQTANLQAIHNSPDTAVATVDIWITSSAGTSLLFDDMNFRKASTYVQVPSGIQVTIGIAPATSTSISDTLTGLSYTTDSFTTSENYVLMASGNIGSGYASNPAGVSNTFEWLIYTPARTTAQTPGDIDFIFANASPDADAVDIYLKGNTTAIEDSAVYKDFSTYTNVTAGKYVIDLTAQGSTVPMYTYLLDLTSYGSRSAVIFTSGYIDSTQNNNGPSFGIFAAFDDGTVQQFTMPVTQVQLIHNSADASISSIDVYAIYGSTVSKIRDDVDFRTASGFIDLPALSPLSIVIANASSTSIADSITGLTQFFTLDTSVNYVLIAQGNVGSGYAPNPDAISTVFNLLQIPNARTSAQNTGDIDFVIVHGTTDVTSLDIEVQGGATLATALPYNQATAYTNLTAANYTVDIFKTGDTTPLSTHAVDLSGLGNSSAVIFTSGYLDSSVNNNGPSMELWAALANGTVINFPLFTTPDSAAVQFIHNSSAMPTGSIDVYATINGISSLWLDDVDFREATPFMQISAGVDIQFSVAPGTSTSVADTIAGLSFTYNLTANDKYILFAQGNTGSGYAANPDAIDNSFKILNITGARTAAQNTGDADFILLHGTADATALDIKLHNSTTLTTALPYDQYTPYNNLAAGTYVLDIFETGDTTPIGMYQADLSVAGTAAVIFTSGYLDSTVNNNGPSFSVWMADANGTVTNLPLFTAPDSAMVQVIHNAASVSAATVDVYAVIDGNASLWLDDLSFRQATAFANLPAGKDIMLAIAPGTSTSIADSIAGTSVTYNLNANENYALVVLGNTDTGYAANPDAISTALQLVTLSNLRMNALVNTDVDFVTVHGTTDAPGIDIKVRSGATLATGIQYAQATAYNSLAATGYIVDVFHTGDTTPLATFVVDLTGYDSATAVFFTSGYLDSTLNQNGPSFGLWAAFTDGTVINFPAFVAPDSANIQFIHNAPSMSAATIDVYAVVGGNASLWLDDIGFRSASTFAAFPAGSPVVIAIAPGTSTSVSDTLAGLSATYNLTANDNYLLVATGNMDTGYTANPDAIPNAFELLAIPGARMAAQNSTDVDVLLVHASPDAPASDVKVVGGATLATGILYKQSTSYNSLAPTVHDFAIYNSGDTVAQAIYRVELSGETGKAGAILTSGYKDSAANQNGASLVLMGVFADGTVELYLPVPPPVESDSASIQLIHNAADPGVATIDIYLTSDNASTKLLDDFAFRTATPFLKIAVNDEVKITLAPANSNSIADSISGSSFVHNFDADGKTILTVTGNNGSGFASNPSGVNTALGIHALHAARTEGSNTGSVDAVIMHGTSDAALIDVLANTTLVLADDIKYKDTTSYVSIPVGSYTTMITNGSRSVVIGSYTTDLSTWGGKSAVLMSSGYFDPTQNNNGPAFAFIGVLADGTVVIFPNSSSGSVNKTDKAGNVVLYPNPATEKASIALDSRIAGKATLQWFDVNGKMISEEAHIVHTGANQLSVNTAAWAQGVYTYRLLLEDNTFAGKLIINK